MTRIKFRALSTNNKDWIYGFPLLYGFENWIADFGGVKRNIKPKTVGQFTGQIDVNGVEIYEGDIFKGYKNFVVEYDEYYGGFLPFTHDGGCGCCSDGEAGQSGACGEVVGNIHENPELLEVNES